MNLPSLEYNQLYLCLFVERFKKFQKVILGNTDKVEVPEIAIKDYAKYVLREDKDLEKRELMGSFKSRITLKDKVVELV